MSSVRLRSSQTCWRISVKPSAKPTLVRTQHLPRAKPQARAGVCFVSLTKEGAVRKIVSVRRLVGFCRSTCREIAWPGRDGCATENMRRSSGPGARHRGH